MKGFLTGIGLGAALGLWLAPETGSETRRKLMIRAAELAKHLEKRLEGKSEKFDDLVNVQSGAEENKPFVTAEADSGNHKVLPAPDPVAEVLNNASKTQLRKVPGIGDATARRIIENRPFESEAEAMESKVMSDTVLKKLKDKLVDVDEDI